MGNHVCSAGVHIHKLRSVWLPSEFLFWWPISVATHSYADSSLWRTLDVADVQAQWQRLWWPGFMASTTQIQSRELSSEDECFSTTFWIWDWDFSLSPITLSVLLQYQCRRKPLRWARLWALYASPGRPNTAKDSALMGSQYFKNCINLLEHEPLDLWRL